MFSQKRRSTYVKELFQVVDPVVAFKKLPEEIAKSLGKVLIHVTYSNGVVKPYTLAKLIVKMEEKESFVLNFPSIFKDPVSVVDGKVPAAGVEDEPAKKEVPVKEDEPVVEEKVEETPAPKTEAELEKAPVEVVEEKVEEVAEDVVEAEPAEVVEEAAAAVGIAIGGKGAKKKKK